MTPTDNTGPHGIEISWRTVYEKIDRIDISVAEIKVDLKNYEERFRIHGERLGGLDKKVEELQRKVWGWSGIASLISSGLTALLMKGLG